MNLPNSKETTTLLTIYTLFEALRATRYNI